MDSPLRKRSFGPLQKGQRRKREIVDAAIRAIATEGLHRCTLEAVARALQVQRAHVAYHYPTIEALWGACFEETVRVGQEHTQSSIQEADDPRKTLMKIVDSFFLWADEQPAHAAVQLAFYHWAEVDAEFRRVHANVRAVALERLGFVLQAGYRLSASEARRVAVRIHCLLFGSLMLVHSLQGEKGAPTLLQLQADAHSAIFEALPR
jgi:AcrR family transcriptional regulator